MLSKSKKMLMNLNSKQKSLCQLATVELFPNDTGKQQKNDKRAFGYDASYEWFLVYPSTHTDLYFLA